MENITTNSSRVTKRDIYAALRDMAERGMMDFTEINPNVDAEYVINMCTTEIDSLTRKAAKQKERNEAKVKEIDPLRMPVLNALNDTDWMTSYDVLDIMEIPEDYDDELTSGKVSYRLSALARDNVIDKSKVKVIDQETGKTKNLTAYRLLPADEVSAE